VHHPACLRNLTLCGIHSPTQPWGKLDSKKLSQKLSEERLDIKCLMRACNGRVQQTVLEKDRGGKGKVEVWYHARWHQEALAQDAEKRAAEEEERLRKIEEKRAAAAAKAAAVEEEGEQAKLSKGKLKKEKRREAAIAAKQAVAIAAEGVLPLPGQQAATNCKRGGGPPRQWQGLRGGDPRQDGEKGWEAAGETEKEREELVAQLMLVADEALLAVSTKQVPPVDTNNSQSGKKAVKAERERSKRAHRKQGQRLEVEFCCQGELLVHSQYRWQGFVGAGCCSSSYIK
jgi:hypothetical protein